MRKFRKLPADFLPEKFIAAILLALFVLPGSAVSARPAVGLFLKPVDGSENQSGLIETEMQSAAGSRNDVYGALLSPGGENTQKGEAKVSSKGCKSFEGKWDGGSYGYMTLTQNGNTVSGFYEWGGTHEISGTVKGNILIGKYSQMTYSDPRYQTGRIEFTLSKNGNSWSGYWTDRDGNRQGSWSGKCLGPNKQ